MPGIFQEIQEELNAILGIKHEPRVRVSLANSSEDESTFSTQTEDSSDDEGDVTGEESLKLSKPSLLDIPRVQKIFSNVQSSESFQTAFSELKKHAIAVYSKENAVTSSNQSDLSSVICKDSLVSQLLSFYDSVLARKPSIFSPILQSYLPGQLNENTPETIFTSEQINDLLILVERAKSGLQAYQAIQDYIREEGLTIPLSDPLMSALLQQYICLQQRQHSDLSSFVELYALPAQFVAAHEPSRESSGKDWAESVLLDARVYSHSVPKNDLSSLDKIDIERMCEIVETTRDVKQAIDAVDAYRKAVSFRPFSSIESTPEEAFSHRAGYFLERERDKTYPLLFEQCVKDFLTGKASEGGYNLYGSYEKEGLKIAQNPQLTPFEQCQQLVSWLYRVSADADLAGDKTIGPFLQQIVTTYIKKAGLYLDDCDALIRLMLTNQKKYTSWKHLGNEWFKNLSSFECIDQLLVARAKQTKFNSPDSTVRVAALEDFALFLESLREEYGFVRDDLSAAVVSRLRLEEDYVENPSLKPLFDKYPIEVPAIHSPILRNFIDQCPKDTFKPDQIRAMLACVEPVATKDASLVRYRNLYYYVRNLPIDPKYKDPFRNRFVALQQSTFKEGHAAKFAADLLSLYQKQLHPVDVARLTDEIAAIMEANEPKNPAERQQKSYSAVIQYIDALTSRLDLRAFEAERLSSLRQLRSYCVQNSFGDYLFFSQFIDEQYAKFQSKIPETAQHIDNDKLSKNCLLAKLESFILSVQSCYESDKEAAKKAISDLVMRYLILVNPGQSHYYDLINFLFYQPGIWEDFGKFNVQLASDLLRMRLVQLGKIEGLSKTQLSERQAEIEVIRKVLVEQGSVYRSSGLSPVYEGLERAWGSVKSSLDKAVKEDVSVSLSPQAGVYAYPGKGGMEVLFAGLTKFSDYINFVHEMIQLKKENQLIDIDKSLLLILLEQSALVEARSKDGPRDQGYGVIFYNQFLKRYDLPRTIALDNEFGEPALQRMLITFFLHSVQVELKEGLTFNQTPDNWSEDNFKSVLKKLFYINQKCRKLKLIKQNSLGEFIDGNSLFKAMYRELDTAFFWSDFRDKQGEWQPAAILLLKEAQNNDFGNAFVLYALKQKLTTVRTLQEGEDLLKLVLRLDEQLALSLNKQGLYFNSDSRNKGAKKEQTNALFTQILDVCLEKCTRLDEYNRLVEMVFHRIPDGENLLDWSKLVAKIDTLDEYQAMVAAVSEGAEKAQELLKKVTEAKLLASGTVLLLERMIPPAMGGVGITGSSIMLPMLDFDKTVENFVNLSLVGNKEHDKLRQKTKDKGYLVYPYVEKTPYQTTQVRLFVDKTINLMAKKFADRHDADQGELWHLFTQTGGREDFPVDPQIDLSTVESLKAFQPTPHPALFKEITNQYQAAIGQRSSYFSGLSDDDQTALRAVKQVYLDEKVATVNQTPLRQCCDLLTTAYWRLNRGDLGDRNAEHALIAQVLLTFMATRPSDADYQALLCFLCDRKIQYGDKLGFFTERLINNLLLVKMESFQKFADTELFVSMIEHLSAKYGYDVAGDNVRYIMKLQLNSPAFRHRSPTDDIDLLVRRSFGGGGITKLDFVNFDLLENAQFFKNESEEEFNFYQKFITNILAHTQPLDEQVMTKLFRVRLDRLKWLQSFRRETKPSSEAIAFLDFLAEKSKTYGFPTKKVLLEMTNELLLDVASYILPLQSAPKFSNKYFKDFIEIFNVYQDYVKRHQLSNEPSDFHKKLVNSAIDQCQLMRTSDKKGGVIKDIAWHFAYFDLHKNEPFSLDFFNRLIGDSTAKLPKYESANIDNFAELATAIVYVYHSFLKIDQSFIEPPLGKVLKAWFSHLSTFEEYKKSINALKNQGFFSINDQVRENFKGKVDSTTLTSLLNKSPCLDLANFAFNSEKMAQAIKEDEINGFLNYRALLKKLIRLLKDRNGHFCSGAVPFVKAQIAAFAKIDRGLTLSILTSLEFDQSEETEFSIGVCMKQIIESEKAHYSPLLKTLIQVSDREGQLFQSFSSTDLNAFASLSSGLDLKEVSVGDPLVFSDLLISACRNIVATATGTNLIGKSAPKLTKHESASRSKLRDNALLIAMVLQKPSTAQFSAILKTIPKNSSLLNDLLVLRAQSLETPTEFAEFSAFLKANHLVIEMIPANDEAKKPFSELTQQDLGMISLQRQTTLLDNCFSNAAQCQQFVTEVFKLKEHYQLPLEKMDRALLLRILARGARCVSYSAKVDLSVMESLCKMCFNSQWFDKNNIPNSSAYFDFMRVVFATSPRSIPLLNQLVNQLPIDTSRITNPAAYVELIVFCLGMGDIPSDIMQKLISRLPLLEFLKFGAVLQQKTAGQNQIKQSQLFHSVLRQTLMNDRFMPSLLKQLDTPAKRLEFVIELQKITEAARDIVKDKQTRLKFVEKCHNLMKSQLVVLKTDRVGEFDSVAQECVLPDVKDLIDGNNHHGNYAYLMGSPLLQTFENWVAKRVDEYTQEKQDLTEKVNKIADTHDAIEVINLEKDIAQVKECKNSLETKFKQTSKRCNDLADQLNERLAVQKQKNQVDYLQQSKQLSDFEKRGVLPDALAKQQAKIEQAEWLREKCQALSASDPQQLEQYQIDLEHTLLALEAAFVEKDTFFNTALTQLKEQHQKFDSAKTLVEAQAILVGVDEALVVANQTADQCLAAVETRLAAVEKVITDGEAYVKKIESQKVSNEARYQSAKTNYAEKLTQGKAEIEALQALEETAQDKKRRLFGRVKFDELPLTEHEKAVFLNSQEAVEAALSDIDQSLLDQIWRFKESHNRWGQKSRDVDQCLGDPKALVKAQTDAVDLYVLEEKNVSVWMEILQKQRVDIGKRIEIAQKTLEQEEAVVRVAFIKQLEDKRSRARGLRDERDAANATIADLESKISHRPLVDRNLRETRLAQIDSRDNFRANLEGTKITAELLLTAIKEQQSQLTQKIIENEGKLNRTLSLLWIFDSFFIRSLPFIAEWIVEWNGFCQQQDKLKEEKAGLETLKEKVTEVIGKSDASLEAKDATEEISLFGKFFVDYANEPVLSDNAFPEIKQYVDVLANYFGYLKVHHDSFYLATENLERDQQEQTRLNGLAAQLATAREKHRLLGLEVEKIDAVIEKLSERYTEFNEAVAEQRYLDTLADYRAKPSPIVAVLRDKYKDKNPLPEVVADRLLLDLVLHRPECVNLRDGSQVTPLYLAVEHGNEKDVQWLLAHHADRTKGVPDQTPLTLAFRNHQKKLVDLFNLPENEMTRRQKNSLNQLFAESLEELNWNCVRLLLDNRDWIGLPKDALARALHKAIVQGNFEIVDQLGVPSAFDDLVDDKTALRRAIEQKTIRLDIIAKLLEKGADVNQRSQGYTPLSLAVQSGHVGLVQLLLAREADVRVTTPTTRLTPLHVALKQSPISLDILKVLLQAKHVDVSALNAENKSPFAAVSDVTKLKDDQGDNLLHWALKEKNILLVEKLLNGPFASSKAANMPNASGDTPLHLAVALRNQEVFKILVKNGADIKAVNPKRGKDLLQVAVDAGATELQAELKKHIKFKTDEKGNTLLHLAVLSEHVEDVKSLEGLLEDVNTWWFSPIDNKNKRGDTALHLAVERGNLAMVELLLKSKADPNILRRDGSTALHLAVERGNLAMVKSLLANGANANLRRSDGHTLFLSVYASSFEPELKLNLLSCLLHQGRAEIDLEDKIHGNGLWHIAVSQKDKGMIALLKKRTEAKWFNSSILNDKNPAGHTLLHLAVSQNDIELVKWLLKRGVDVNQQDEQGNTALHLAIAQANPDIVRELLAKGPKFVKNQAGETPLLSAINARDPAILAELKNHIGAWNTEKSDLLNQVGGDNDAALHKAIRQGDLALVKWLLDTGAYVNQLDAQGNTPLHLVLREKQEKLRGAHHHLADSYRMSAVYDSMIRLLLAKKPDLLLRDQEGNTALLLAIKQNDSAAESQFMQHIGKWLYGKANLINLADNQDNTALHLAANRWNVDLVNWLVDKGADVNAVNQAQETPFSSDQGYNFLFNLTTANVKLPLVKTLEGKGITLSSMTRSVNPGVAPAIPPNPNYNPFNIPVDQPPPSNVVVKSAEVVAPREIDPSKLIDCYDCERPKWLTIQAMIVDDGYPLDVSKENGNTLLHLAAAKGDLLVIQFLLRQATLRQEAAMSNGIAPEVLLVDQWVALLEKPNAEGDTALHIAVKTRNYEVAQLLLQTMGGHYSSENKEHKTCLAIAFEQQDPKLFGLLLAKSINWRSFTQAKMKLDSEALQRFWIEVAQQKDLPVIRRKMLLGQECTVKNTSHKVVRKIKGEGETRTTTLATIYFEAAMSKDEKKAADSRVLILNLMERSGYDKGVVNTFTARMDFANEDVRQVWIALIQSVPEAQRAVLINAADCRGNTLLHSAIERLDIEKDDESKPGSVQWCLGYGAIPKPALGKEILPFFQDMGGLLKILQNKAMNNQSKCDKFMALLTKYAPTLSEAKRQSRLKLCKQCLKVNIPGGYLAVIGLLFETCGFDFTPQNLNNISVLALARKKWKDELNSPVVRLTPDDIKRDIVDWTSLRVYMSLITQVVQNFEAICKSEQELLPDAPKRKVYASEPGDTELHKFISMGWLQKHWDSTLVDLPSHIHTPNHLGRTPLHLAVFIGDVEAAKFLLEKGALVNARFADTAEQMGETPLHRLASRVKTADFPKERFLQLTQLLLEKGAENVLDKQHSSILHKLAARKDDVGLAMFTVILDYLLKDKPGTLNLDARGGEHEMTVLHHLAKHRHDAEGLAMFKRMLDAGADVNVQDARGWTVLHHLTQADDEVAMQMLDLILQTKRADLKLESYAEGYTPAMAAFIGGNEEFLKRVPLGMTDELRFLRNEVKETVQTIKQKVTSTPPRSTTPEGRMDAVYPPVFPPVSPSRQREEGERPSGSPKNRNT